MSPTDAPQDHDPRNTDTNTDTAPTAPPVPPADDGADKPAGGRLRLAVVVPIVGIALFALFAWGLRYGSNDLPSVMLNKPVPQFDLQAVKGREGGLATPDLQGHVSLVNVFASWCVPCRAEHPLIMALAEKGEFPIYGFNYKDDPEAARAWLAQLGDPYSRTGADLDGRVAIEWGSYGVPETFIIDGQGRIAYRHVGPLTQDDIDNTILPLARKLRDDAAAGAANGTKGTAG
ncbi:cytochrome c biogenesis protein CcmG/thiol:disulfide interchange protein DsbE [Brevirhabdus pacifica]|uniref:DsbE family thiol:disulfide interchange protein n=1 Tax=Brevirhabdus pacifica TaxID=1267768 RepID=UPI0009FA268C|nr:DsbE family thiol:disulfide interchange protein [Brevirhabdus pacifica]PJJ85486.1 cytochrome c biogenesis protein CcmG/thiol:disulfide interchange protein DsbE [Brevirhabdus pacifica]